ncbi:MAG: aspartate aminotransferase family protein [Thaumarchaeota archaeon]|nr:aspartate aminotransferase family protein [Candidatus Calditenuaceae archaeon]MDW8187323.1 aspartate aminotransferase family protein [Nitrososphaerota archaeon]
MLLAVEVERADTYWEVQCISRGRELVKLIRFFAPRGLRVKRAEGQYVWDQSGKRYLDYHTGNGAALLGHLNPYVVRRLREQLGQVMVLPPLYDSDVLDETLDALDRVLPDHLGNVFFQNSGSEAVELALKLARKRTKRRKLVAFTGSFHGRTFGALSATFNKTYREGYDPFPFEVEFLPFNEVDQIEKIGEDVAAVILEPVQGEGGLTVARPEFLREVEKRCRDVGAFLVIDEVQSGFGRTGSVWAHSESGVRADMLVAGKSIGGGFPVSFVAVTDEVASRVEDGEHGSTHGGNPLALAALMGGVEALRGDNVPERAGYAGSLLADGLKEVASQNPKVVRGVKGKGLMLGLDLRFSPSQVIKELQSKGLLTLRAGTTVLRLLPPYVITEEDIGVSVQLIDSVLKSYQDDLSRR